MTFTVVSGTTPVYSAVLKDSSGSVIPASSLTTLTLTVFDEYSRAIINTRNRQNVLNTNNVTISEVGALAWAIQVADLQATSETFYRAVFEWTWNSGTKSGSHDFTLRVIPVARP